ncbi:hypothetical protein KVE05_00605 [Helicobacter pylori]|nr:hypothetical protein KVE05_00605 [Helicobacter pylori]
MNKNEMEFYNNFSNLGALTIYYALHGLHKMPLENFLNFADLFDDSDGYGGDKIVPFYMAQLAGLVHFVPDVIIKGSTSLIVNEVYIRYLLRRFKEVCANKNIISVLLTIQQNATEEKSPLLTTIATQIVKLFDNKEINLEQYQTLLKLVREDKQKLNAVLNDPEKKNEIVELTHKEYAEKRGIKL